MQDLKQKLHFYKIIFSYDGSRFGGSAKQPNGSGVQNVLDSALARLGAQEFSSIEIEQNADSRISFLNTHLKTTTSKQISLLASRTDKGVHALTNVGKVAFAYEVDAEYLKAKIAKECSGLFVRSLIKCKEDFQPRFDAKERSYRYVIYCGDAFANMLQGVNLCALSELKPCEHSATKLAKSHAFLAHLYAVLPQDFQLCEFVKAAAILKGEHDFKALCLNAAEQASTIRRINNVRVYLSGGFLVFNIFSSGFLRGQIRLIMGALLAVASGKISYEQWCEQLSGEREHIRLSAPAGGLYLKSIKY